MPRPRANDLQPGDRLGCITVERVEYIDEPYSVTIIVGRCECGRPTRNGRHNLIASIRRGHEPRCNGCEAARRRAGR